MLGVTNLINNFPQKNSHPASPCSWVTILMGQPKLWHMQGDLIWGDQIFVTGLLQAGGSSKEVS